MTPGLFLVAEGVDKAGKTTLLSYVYDKLESECAYCKGLGGDSIIGKVSSSNPSTLLFLLEQLYCDNTCLEKNLNQDKVVLQDRWYYSVVSYPQKNLVDETSAQKIVSILRKPDLLIYFTCSLEERMNRLRTEPTKEHVDLIKHPEKIIQWEENMLQHYDDFNGNKYLVDTTDRNVEECGDKLIEIIKNHKNC
jgi:thymidylate kinase